MALPMRESLLSIPLNIFVREMPDTIVIGSRPEASGSCPMRNAAIGPIADKFFLLGVLSGVLGGALLGVTIWLSKLGLYQLSNYAALRELHIVIQTYLYFGLPVLGFVLQTAPRVLQLKVQTTVAAYLLIPLLFLGLTFRLLMPTAAIGGVISALPFILCALFVAGAALRSKIAFRYQYASWLVFSLVSFSVFSFISLVNITKALLFFWFTLTPVSFMTGQQFIVSFLGGRRLDGKENFLLQVAFLVAALLLLWSDVSSYPFLWRLSGLAVCLTLSWYTLRSGLWISALRNLKSPLGFSFFASYIWAFVGGVLLVLKGMVAADGIFHLWALGWMSTLLMAISCQIITAMSGRALLKNNSI